MLKVSKLAYSVFQSTKNMSEEYFLNEKRMVRVTPKNFIDFVNYFSVNIEEKKMENRNQRHKLQLGLDKLQESKRNVVELQEKLLKLQPIL